MPRKGAKNSTLPRTYAAIIRIAAGKKSYITVPLCGRFFISAVLKFYLTARLLRQNTSFCGSLKWRGI